MSEADRLFDELGYKKLNKKETKLSFDNDFIKLLLCVYEAPMYNFIYFYNDKTFNFTTTKNMQELQAINLKCRELGWIGGEDE